MSETLPPLSGGYPTVAIVTVTAEHQSLGWAVAFSDSDETSVILAGSGTSGAELNNTLAAYALAEAQRRAALVRVWRPGLAKALSTIGGDEYLDIPDNALTTDHAYRALLSQAAEAAEHLAAQREADAPAAPRVRPLVIAVDGSRSRSGDGAWAWIDETGRFGTETGRCSDIAQAELNAIAAALRSADPNRPVRILCDSRFAIRSAQLVLDGEPIPASVSHAVGRAMHGVRVAAQNHDVTLEWVKGHNGHPLNDRADRLAVHARRTRDFAQSDVPSRIAMNIASLTGEGVLS